MYGAYRKMQFLRDYATTSSLDRNVTRVFNALEQYEEAWGADICTRSVEELQPVIDQISGMRAKSEETFLNILKAYARWCLQHRVPNACDSLLKLQKPGVEKLKQKMVSNPLHLQMYLNSVFAPEEAETIDNIYRCYFWMAYGGMKDTDVLLVRKEDVDLAMSTIRYQSMEFHIYREAFPAFRNAVELEQFVNPANGKRRNRFPGDTIIRGVRGELTLRSLRNTVTKHTNAAAQRGDTDMRLSFEPVKLSGLFYRVYERERAGLLADFSDYAIRQIDGKTYKLHGEIIEEKKMQRKIERELMEDYERWKAAFLV